MARKPRALTLKPASLPALVLEQARLSAEAFARASRAASTWRAYEADWRAFSQWCESVKRPALPAEVTSVALFIAAQAKLGIAPSTLSRRLAAIRLMHIGAKLPSPHDGLEVAEVMRGVRRTWKRPAAQKAPAVDEEIRRMVDALDPQTIKGLRDRALLLLGFAGALRRSELVALDVDHLVERVEGFTLTIASSKTDQEGMGHRIAIPRVDGSVYSPVEAVKDWLSKAKITAGPVFRRMNRGDKVSPLRLTAQSVALVVKELAEKVALDPGRYAGHSLRSGFLTSAARNRASIFKMADQSRHKSLDVLRHYVREEERFEDHAGAGLLGKRPLPDLVPE